MARIITIHSRDKIETHDFTKAYVFANKYKKLIKKKEVHSPVAAKVIVHHMSKVKAFYLPKPIIKSDKDGNIDVYSDYEYNLIIGKNGFVKDEAHFQQNKKILKILEYKKGVGLSVEEFFSYTHLKTINELYKIINRVEKLEKGGGF